jgi:transcriptional regulator with XRE-family HTH domain
MRSACAIPEVAMRGATRSPATIFGENLRRIRIERGLSQKQLAVKSRVHRNTIYALEAGLTGTKRGHRAKTIEKIIEALDCTRSDLYGDGSITWNSAPSRLDRAASALIRRTVPVPAAAVL